MSLVSELTLLLRRPQVPRMLANLGWLAADKAVRLGMGLFVGVAMARHLGPSQFGSLNYALALVGLFAVFASLGLDSIVQRDLIRQPGDSGRLLGTCFGLRMVSALVCYAAFLVLVSLTVKETPTRMVCFVAGVTLLGGAGGGFDFWFQSQLLAKYSVYAMNSAFVAASLVRLALIWNGAGSIAFAWTAVLEGALAVSLFASFYWKLENAFKQWNFDVSLAKRWLRECWPLILSSLAVSVYMRIDQVMLGKMLDEHAVGVYSVAVRISEIGYFIPLMLASTLLPSISRSRELGEAIYHNRRQQYFDLSSVLAFLLIVPCSLSARWLVQLLYGPSYQEAASILLVHIWSALFVFMGVARGQYLLMEGQLKFSFHATMAGAVINVALNFLLIPRYGGLGAAWATLVAYGASAFFSSFLHHQIVSMGLQQWKSFNLPLALHRLLFPR